MGWWNRNEWESPEAVEELVPEETWKLSQALYDRPELLRQFVAENPMGLSPEELSIADGWQHMLRGDFFFVRALKRHAVLLQEDPPHLYGVLGLESALEEHLFYGMSLPAWVNTTLLPFKGQVIYDGLMNMRTVFFGPGIRRRLNNTYRELKQSEGLLECWEAGSAFPSPKKKGSKGGRRRAG